MIVCGFYFFDDKIFEFQSVQRYLNNFKHMKIYEIIAREKKTLG